MIFDGHADVWTDVLARRLKGETHIFRRYHLDKFRQGGIEGSIFVIWADPPYTDVPYQRTIQIMDALNAEVEECKDILVIVKNYEEILKAKAENKIYVLIGCEGLSSIGKDITLIDKYYDFGARHMALTWNEQNDLATGVRGHANRGLTELGWRAIEKILEKNILFDVSHLNDKSFWEVIAKCKKPVIASHSNVRSLCNVPRNLTDEQLKAIAHLDGVIGLNSFNEFVHEEIAKQDIQHLVEHIQYMKKLIGIDHIGFGFDFSEFIDSSTMNAFASQSSPFTIGLEDASYAKQILFTMKKAGFSDTDIEKVCYQNFHRVIRNVIG